MGLGERDMKAVFAGRKSREVRGVGGGGQLAGRVGERHEARITHVHVCV